MTSSTGKEHQGNLELQQEKKGAGPVECLGLTFENEEARRDHFVALLKEKLQDPEFRKIPGFPQGSDEAILQMSDPPYYTACPNPFLGQAIASSDATSDRSVLAKEPLAIDVSEGKYDWLYRSHPYHTKVPHLAIVPSILHYTSPGDVVLDAFCGSGMTGIATQLCENPSRELRGKISAQWSELFGTGPKWGKRTAILSDLSPYASFIAAGYNLEFDLRAVKDALIKIRDAAESEFGWAYKTCHNNEQAQGDINFVVLSELFNCSECAGEIIFTEVADSDGETSKIITCPHCGARSTKENMDLVFTSFWDARKSESRSLPKRIPVLIEYTYSGRVFKKKPDASDLKVIQRLEELGHPRELPMDEFPDCQMTRVGRMRTTKTERLDDLFSIRSATVLSSMWRQASEIKDFSTRRMCFFALQQIIGTGSLLNRYRPNSSFGNGPLRGVYYMASQIAEASVLQLLDGIITRLERGFGPHSFARNGNAFIGISGCQAIQAPSCSVDYIFTDPPFGENIYYADLNLMTEAWHRVYTDTDKEAIVDRVRGKQIEDYQRIMRKSFDEYYRVLKPGRWMTVVFSNSKNSVWRAIQEAMGGAGFVVADVRTLDKKQGSFKQVTSSAVKQDLVISAYRPSEELEKSFRIGASTPDAAWIFVREHLSNVPVFVGRSNEVEVVAERTPQMLMDRMIGFHVQHGVSVPLSGPEFLQGLQQRFPERDGMYFLPDQVTEYDRKRTTATQLRQLSFYVNDEHSAIQWIRQQLQDKPQGFQDLQPQFMRELQAWAKHEQTVELKVILEQNFLHYEGRGPVPSQVHSYLSSNFKDLRNLDKEDSKLIEKALDRWYVPDPNKQADLDQIRDRALLKEFEELKESSQRRIKQFRTEAVRAGFKACWQERDYATIVKVAAKLPEAVLQEDEKLLMYIDNAQTRLGDDA